MTLTALTDSALIPSDLWLSTISWLGAGLSSGLLASAHCVAMCGGIAMGIEQTTSYDVFEQETNRQRRWQPSLKRILNANLLLPHLCRITLYSLLGFITYLIINNLLLAPNANTANNMDNTITIFQSLSIPRWLPALALFAGAFSFSKLLQKNRKAGSCGHSCQKRSAQNFPNLHTSQKTSQKNSQRIPVKNIDTSNTPTFIRYLKWGWGLLPCPMVIGMLIICTQAPNSVAAAGFMFLFGLGSLPGLLGISMIIRLCKRLGKRWLPNSSNSSYNKSNIQAWLIPAMLCLSGVWTLSHGWLMSHDATVHQRHAIQQDVLSSNGLSNADPFQSFNPMNSLCRPRKSNSKLSLNAGTKTGITPESTANAFKQTSDREGT